MENVTANTPDKATAIKYALQVYVYRKKRTKTLTEANLRTVVRGTKRF